MGGKQENLAAFKVIRQTLEKIEKKKKYTNALIILRK
jgi:DNA-binding XRE family transcriptional regulator